MTRFRARSVALAVLAAAAPALAQVDRSYDPPADAAAAVTQVQALVPRAAESERSELTLAPAIAAMEPVPGAVPDEEQVAIAMFPGRPGWEDAAAWASAAPQQAVIEALKKVTEVGGRSVFALPYADPPEHLVEAGLTVDLGSPPLLAAAAFNYIDTLDDVAALVHIEATRLASEGKAKDAIDLLIRWMRLQRQIVDRAFFEEKMYAFVQAIFTLERIRDVAYVYAEALSEEEVIDAIEQLADDRLYLERIVLPEGDRIAALQLVALTISSRGGPNPETFGPTMARLAAGDRPLQLFGESAWWQRAAANHADWFDAIDRLEDIFEDWHFRWDLPDRDSLLSQPTDFQAADPARVAIFAETIDDFDLLFRARLATRIELAGTRQALGVLAYNRRLNTFPPLLSSIRGRYISRTDTDPLNPLDQGRFSYFVPIRDQPLDQRAGPKPHEIKVGPGSPVVIAIEAAQFSADAAAANTDVIASGGAAEAQKLRAPGGLLETMKAWAAEGITKDNVAEKIDTAAAKATTLAPKAADAELREIMTSALTRLFNDPGFDAAYAKVVAKRKEPTDEELFGAMAAVDRIMADALDEAGRAARRLASGPFTVSYRDDVFILYSVGPDGKPQWASSVGSGGSDLLLWPPLISVLREHAYPSAAASASQRRPSPGIQERGPPAAIRRDNAMTTRDCHRIVIIGSGPAAWTAAIYAARAQLEPVVYTGVPKQDPSLSLPGGQLMLTTDVENYPGFPDGVTGPEMMELFQKQAERFGTTVRHHHIASCDFSQRPFRLKTEEGEEICAHSVVVATGAVANWLNLENEMRLARIGGGVSACAVCDGALPLFRGKPLAVVGGGDTAMEEATYLTKFASVVYVIHRRSEFRASKIMQQRFLSQPNAKVLWNKVVVDVLGADKVTGVALEDTITKERTTLDVAGLFIAIGHTPATRFLEGTGLEFDESGYMLVKGGPGPATRTNIPGVFAAGDVSDGQYRQAITAAGMGCMAALDAERWLAAEGIH